MLCCALAHSPVHAVESPFEPLTAAEQRTAFEVVITRFHSDPALPHGDLRFPLVALAEPPKAGVLGVLGRQPSELGQTAPSLPRRAEVEVLHYPDNRSWSALVDLTSQRVLQLVAVAGQPALTADEYMAAATLIAAHKPWQEAMRARGLDPAQAYIDVWAGGDALPEQALARASHGPETRVVQGVTFLRLSGAQQVDNPYDRPVEGLIAMVDLNARQVIALIDQGARPVSTETGNASLSQPLKPLQVVEPRGSELMLQGHFVRYRNWQFYAVLQPREGLVLYDVRIRDRGRLRRVAYRLALSELYVPYGIADANWTTRHALDVGEYNAGLNAQRLTRGVDVPENARLLDAMFFSDLGPSSDNPDGKRELPETLAIFERSAGLLWTRSDPSTSQRDSRIARELVVSWNTWIGNYIYGFEWVFKLDGSIEVRSQLHGTTLNRGTDEKPEPSAPKLGRDARGAYVAAPHHQHFLSFRLDLDIDGEKNQVMEMEVAPLGDPAFKNAFDTRTRNITAEGFRDVAPLQARHWHVESSTAKNAFGKRTSYAIEPESLAFPYSAPDYDALQHAVFAQHALWLTRQRDSERYAAGDYPYQARPREGVARFVTPQEGIVGEDLVIWYTTGFTHIARPEDYPVMSGETVSFKLVPRGFFDQNPALDVGDVELGVTPKPNPKKAPR
jgi:primary-amine oxidase